MTRHTVSTRSVSTSTATIRTRARTKRAQLIPTTPATPAETIVDSTPARTPRAEAGRFWESAAFRAAQADFMGGLWGSQTRRDMFRATMTAIWNDFKSEEQYESLRQHLSEAARGLR